MMQFKWLLSVLLVCNISFANDEWDISIGKVKKDEIVELDKAFPGGAMPELFSSIYIRYLDNSISFFMHSYNTDTTKVKYKGSLKCGTDMIYPTVMFNTDNSFEKASLSVTLIKNRLYIFDKSLNLIKSFESTYHSEEDDDGLYVEREHVFTLDNVEKYACDYIKTLGS